MIYYVLLLIFILSAISMMQFRFSPLTDNVRRHDTQIEEKVFSAVFPGAEITLEFK